MIIDDDKDDDEDDDGDADDDDDDNHNKLNDSALKGPSQPHLCFCLHTRIWLLHLICSTSKRRKSLSNY